MWRQSSHRAGSPSGRELLTGLVRWPVSCSRWNGGTDAGCRGLEENEDVPSARPLRLLVGDHHVMAAVSEVISDLYRTPEYHQVVERGDDQRLPLGLE